LSVKLWQHLPLRPAFFENLDYEPSSPNFDHSEKEEKNQILLEMEKIN
jgi:hypothetical protein